MLILLYANEAESEHWLVMIDLYDSQQLLHIEKLQTIEETETYFRQKKEYNNSNTRPKFGEVAHN